MFDGEYVDATGEDSQVMVTACLSMLKLVFGEESWSRFDRMRRESGTETIQSLFSWLLELGDERINSSKNYYNRHCSDSRLAQAAQENSVLESSTHKRAYSESISNLNSFDRKGMTCVEGEEVNDDDICIVKEEISGDNVMIQSEFLSSVEAIPGVTGEHLEVTFSAEQKSFYCNQCHVALADIEIIQEHSTHCHNAIPLVVNCTCCSQRFEDVADYVAYHMQLATTKTGHVCGYCAKQFTTKATLMDHVANIHEKVEPKYACPYCGKKFKYARSLRGHKQKCELSSSTAEAGVCSGYSYDREGNGTVGGDDTI